MSELEIDGRTDQESVEEREVALDLEAVGLAGLDDPAVSEGERIPRDLSGWFRWVGSALALMFALYQIAHGMGWIRLATPVAHRAIHVWFAVVLVYLWYSSTSRRGRRRPTIVDLLAIVGASIGIVFIFLAAGDILRMGSVFPPAGTVLIGTLLLIVVLEGTRRVLGLAMPILAVIMFLYAVGGRFIPGLFGNRGFAAKSVIVDVFYSDRGLFGPLVGISAGVIAAFLLFGAVLYRTGGGETFVQVARLVTGKAKGGPAKVSTVSSGLFGIASGSAVANVVVDGVFNIPLMERSGYRRPVAAAIEAVASAGGQLVPPFMGAAAFVMAEFIGIPFPAVAAAATIPAILYYLAVFAAVHVQAVRDGIEGVPRSLLPKVRTIIPQMIALAAPVVLLTYLLLNGYSAEKAVLLALGLTATWHVAAGVAAGDVRRRVIDLFHGLIDGGKSVAGLGVLIIAASIVVRGVDLTGVGVKLSGTINSAAGSSLALALVFAMITTVVLGMGVPTTAAYVIAAAVVVPPLIELGIVPIAAHMFVLYFAVLSAITPPVCPAVYAAATLARTRWTTVAREAVRIALPAFIVPFSFALNPALLLEGSVAEIVIRFAAAAVGVVALAVALVGHTSQPLNPLERILSFTAGLLLVLPSETADLVGLALFVAVVLRSFRRSRPRVAEVQHQLPSLNEL